MSEIKIKPYSIFTNVFYSDQQSNLKLYTKNLCRGTKVYDENLVIYEDNEYREWDPFRSKLAALLLFKPKFNFLSTNQKCLYLGASSGTTISHLSDILLEGIIYGIEIAERSIRQLIQNTSKRLNIIPILGDANYPESYAKSIFSEVDIIYQDVAQPNQAEIAIKNSNYYLKDEGYLIFAIKSQSIDSIQKSEKVFQEEKKSLESGGYEVVERINIHKYAANHIILISQKKL